MRKPSDARGRDDSDAPHLADTHRLDNRSCTYLSPTDNVNVLKLPVLLDTDTDTAARLDFPNAFASGRNRRK